MSPRLLKLVLTSILAIVVLAPAAHAAEAPYKTYLKVHDDFIADSKITACKWTPSELRTARAFSEGVYDDYYNGFPEAVEAEQLRWSNGACKAKPGDPPKPVTPPPSVKESKLKGLKIKKLRPNGAQGSEYLVLRNTTAKSLSLTGVQVSNRLFSRLKFPSTKIKAKASVRVQIGCQTRKRKPSISGGKIYLCAKRAYLRDSGDVVKLIDTKKIVVSQVAYGTSANLGSF